ncbi:hypothetical protein SAMN05216338_1004283 [Bradyrhizobium sp. Rc2d]|uniref:hypothetical protein n=1 Tax=Bradyrhizobium sp. Rc2d TaxID=1855321 RepID=UPI000884DF8D|nr:hypothetical protein [Bradyrhizobium sp. Rc2d]SDH01268.1 hypothetical protein SAMN05216338_1004283 [Bradyrhizobium sp. Rc2d]
MEEVWTAPWYAVIDKHVCKAWEDELRKEIGPEHPLWNCGLRLIARRDDRDDAIFLVGDGRVAEVHLTWSGKPERSPWPRTAIFANMGQWRAARSASDET